MYMQDQTFHALDTWAQSHADRNSQPGNRGHFDSTTYIAWFCPFKVSPVTVAPV